MELMHAFDLPILLRVAGAFALGWIVGYERYFHGRAAGAQVYCLVSMASCALTAAVAYYDGTPAAGMQAIVAPTAVIGSIVTGIGFLGAGIIVKSGTSIRGLSTAASVWSCSALGILVGIGFYGAAVGLTLMLVACMVIVPRIERRLPGHFAFSVTLRYCESYKPSEDLVTAFMEERGLALQRDTVTVAFDRSQFDLQFMVIADPLEVPSLSRVANDLREIPNVESFTLARSSRA